MFFKKIFFIFLVMSFSYPALAGIIDNSTCLKEMKIYYPYLKSGQLHWEKQERFFRCVHDSLELIVVNKIFTHDPNRDYFTKSEIFKMFHVYFKLEKDLSQSLVDNLFLIKHFIVGGELNQLSDKGLRDIYNLVSTYEGFYYIIHKRIGVIHKILNAENKDEISEKNFQFTLSKLGEGLKFLKISYQEQNITYPFTSVDHLFSYLEEYNRDVPSWEKYSQFLRLWMDGLLPPKKNIEGESWDSFFDSFHQMISMFLYYKKYVVKNNISQLETIPRVLKGLEYFVSALSFVKPSQEKQGFPLTNVDEMLSIMVSLSGDQIQLSDDLHILATEKRNPIPLFTRNLICFAFQNNQSENCSYKLGGENSLSLQYHFPDGTFKFYQDKQKWLPQEGASFEATSSQLKSIKQWLSNYTEGYNQLFQEQAAQISKIYKSDHWLTPSFGEMKEDPRIVFYPSSFSSTRQQLPYRLLNYRFLSDLFLFHYKKGEKGYNLSAKNWESVVDEALPVLLAFQREGYDLALRKDLLGLFGYADKFLNSSNGDKFLDDKEVLDLIVHVRSAIDNSKYAYSKILQSCSGALESSCVGDRIFEKDIMEPFPRLQNYLVNYDSKEHRVSTQKLLEDRLPLEKSSDLIDVFLILQMLEVQIQLIDKNKNTLLEHQEIFQVVKKFSDEIVNSVPYIKDTFQSQSFVLYSFKTGRIPFFKENNELFHSLQFFNWHVNHRDEAFDISNGELYSTTLKFYKLYRDHL